MLIPIQHYQQSAKQVDLCFYGALKQRINDQKCSMGFYTVRFLMSVWLLIEHFIRDSPGDINMSHMIQWMFVMMIVFNVCAFLNAFWTYRNIFTNDQFMAMIAQRIQHTRVIDESSVTDIESCFEPIQGMRLRVSRDCYQFENNIMANEVDDQYKKRAQRNCSALLAQQVSISNRWIRLWTQSLNLASISIFTYTIILLSQGTQINTLQFTFIIAYLFTEVCSRLFIYLILFIIGISPLLCFTFCLWSCFCKKDTRIQLPPAQLATLEIVKECQGNCPVCYQDIKQDQKVIVLKCSPKHVFHQLCIKGWTRLRKDTCPVCRATI